MSTQTLPRLKYNLQLQELNDIDIAHGEHLTKAIAAYNDTDGRQELPNYLHNACPDTFLFYPSREGYRVYKRSAPQIYFGLITGERVDPPYFMEKYKPAIEARLSAYATQYTEHGRSTLESPMWYILGLVEGKLVRFESSQRHDLYFTIEMSEEDAETVQYGDRNKVADYFRALKYAYLKQHFPTLYAEIKKL